MQTNPKDEFNYGREAILRSKPLHKKVAIFWGGMDVDPSMYNRPVSDYCGGTDIDQDLEQAEQMLAAIKANIPVIGVCRGAQLLNVVNGGILVQHITNHTNKHNVDINCDFPELKRSLKQIEVSSTHHQMMIPHESGIILAKETNSHAAGVHWDQVNKTVPYKEVVEVVYYPETNSLCIQPHPEWMLDQTYFSEFLRQFMEKVMKTIPFSFRTAESFILKEGSTLDFSNYVSNRKVIIFDDLIKKHLQQELKEKKKASLSGWEKVKSNNKIDTTNTVLGSFYWDEAVVMKAKEAINMNKIEDIGF